MKSVLLLVALASAAHADDAVEYHCPKAGDTYLDDVVGAMKGKSCGAAVLIAKSCGLGASGDVVIAGAATKVCQAGHAKSDKPLFEQLSKRCATKYAGKDGTMYRSFAAYCQLDVAELLWRLNQKPD